MRSSTLPTVAFACLFLCACSSAVTHTPAPPFPGPEDLVTGQDIVVTCGRSALDGLRLFGSHMAVGRGFVSARNQRGDAPLVYLDGARLVDLAVLLQVSPLDVASMTFLDAASATIRYGTGRTSGAIVHEGVASSSS